MFLILSLGELVCVENVLAPSVTTQRGGPAKAMMLRVGSALIEGMQTQADQSVYFEAAELWILRERLSIYASQGADTMLGMRLKAKVYAALIAVSAKETISGLGLGDADADAEYASEGPAESESSDDAEAEAAA